MDTKALRQKILDQMEFVPKMADEIKTMDARIFRDELMGLANDWSILFVQIMQTETGLFI